MDYVTDHKTAAQHAIAKQRDALVALSHRIHSYPEVGLEETRAATWLSEHLETGGFAVERGVAGMPTAFVARSGSGSLHVAFCAEYDALPGIGHACGHNIIATGSTGAGIGLAAVADALDLTVTVFGTPAEENGGGKARMIKAGLFDDVHAAMLVHPNGFDDTAVRAGLAILELHVRYVGKAAHASSAPSQGVNAADALTVAQVAIGLLRQQIEDEQRVHGITTSAGDAPNVIPGQSSATYYVRAPTFAGLKKLEQQVRNCFEAGALATGCTLEYIDKGVPVYANISPDRDMADLYRINAEALGRSFGPDRLTAASGASTDMGNVSQIIPTIQPTIRIEANGASNHQPEFAQACATASADKAVVDSATAMAWTAIDLATTADQRERLRRKERRLALP